MAKSELLADNRGSAEVKKSEPVMMCQVGSEMNHKMMIMMMLERSLVTLNKICVANRAESQSSCTMTSFVVGVFYLSHS